MKDCLAPREFAKLVGRTVNTIQRWDREGILKAHRTSTNRRYYTYDQFLEYIGMKADKEKKTIVYYRVSSSGQKDDMRNQKEALERFCIVNGYAVDDWMSDIGSGLNFNRKNFDSIMEMIERGEVNKLIIAHKDRFVRFGFEWFETFAKRHGTEIIIMNNESLSPQEEMVKDLLSIVHCFSSRLYGLRRYKKKIERVIKIDSDEDDNSI